MNFNLENKNLVVIGGNGNLGKEICLSLLDQKANVISIDLIHNNKTKTINDYLKIETNVSDKSSVRAAIKKIKKVYKTIDGVIYSVTAKPHDFYNQFTECSLSGWKKVLETELDGAFNVAQNFGKIMESQEFGNLIFISSIYGIVGNDQRIYKGSNLSEVHLKGKKKIQNINQNQIFSHAAYPVAKGGIISFCRYLAAYWGKNNIRVNCISPGGIESPGENKKFVKNYSSKVPLGRKARVEEITGSILYLLSDNSNYITGHNLVIDGGYTIW